MKWGRAALAGTLALLVASCGSGKGSGDAAQTDGGGNELPVFDPMDRCPNGVTLSIAGVDRGAVSAFAVALGNLTAVYEHGGAPIEITGMAPGPHDLLAASPSTIVVLHLTDQLWPYALVTLTFSSVSASLGAASDQLDLCSAPLAFHLDPGLVKDTCQIVVTLDVGRSVAQSTTGGAPVNLAFLPQFRVIY